MNRKLMLFGAVALAASMVAVSAFSTLGSSINARMLFAGNSNQWNHYNSVSSSFDKKGIREYWISCNTHEVRFTAPTTGNIVNMGTPTESFINSLADSDSRLLKPSWNTISFTESSDANFVTSVRNNFNVKEIVDDSTAPDGDGKVLKITYKDGTADFMISEDYLIQVFGDSSVVALNFNMKATQRLDIAYRQQATTYRYEGNGTDSFGLNTTWKTFSYPRSAFEAFINDPNKSTTNRNTFLWQGISAIYSSFELYMDNFHPVRKELDWTGFERGRHNPSAAYFSWREGAVGSGGTEVCYIMDGNTSNTVTWSYDDTIKTEGGRSVKVTRAASDGLQFCLRRDNIAWDTLLPNSNSILSFDFRSSSTLNCNTSVSSVLICQNTKLSSGNNFQIPKDTWCRIAIPKSKIDRNAIFSFHGGAAMDVWFDNIQFNTDLGCFEDDVLIKKSSNDWTYGGEYTNPNNHTNVDYTDIRTIKVLGYEGSVGHVGFSYTKKTEGQRSLWTKIVRSDVETAFYMSQSAKQFLTNNAGSTVSFDVYRTSSGNLTFKNGERVALTVPDSNAWSSYCLSASDLTSDGRFLIVQGSNAVGDWYFDNIVFMQPEESNYNTSVLNRNILISDANGTTLFPTRNNPSAVYSLNVDGSPVAHSNIDSFNSSGIYLKNSYLSTLSDGDHKFVLSYQYNNNHILSETYYQNVYYGTLKSSTSVSTSYGSPDYYTLPGSYTNLYRILCNDMDIPFERISGGSTYQVPYASLVEALPTVNNQKSTGTIVLFIFTIDGVYRQPITVNITTANVKSIDSYNGPGIKSFYYSSTQHDSSINTTYQELRSVDKLNEYYNGGNEIVYEQSLHVGTGSSSLSTQLQYLLNNAQLLGKKVILADDAFTALGRTETSLIGNDITVGSNTLHFNNQSELDAYVTSRLNLYINYPACYGVNVGDEETYNQLIHGYSDLLHSIHRCLTALNREDFYINTNLQPMSASAETTTGNASYGGTEESRYRVYLEAYVAASGNNYISYDYYPLLNGNAFDKKGVGTYVFRNLYLAAQIASENGLELHVVTQTFSPDHSSNTLILNSEDVSYLNNMLLAFGVKNIKYFTFYHRGASTGSESWLADGCPMTSDGTRTNLYYYMKAQREQINEFAPVISEFDYEWFYITRASSSSNRGNSPTAYTNAFSNLNPGSKAHVDLKSFDNPSYGWASLTTLYNSDTEQRVYTLQNLYRDKNQASKSFTMQLYLDKKFSYFAVYENGSVRIVNAVANGNENTILNLTLSSGHTVFIVPYI